MTKVERDAIDRIGTQSFNGPELMRRKARQAVKAGVHVMIWELGQDVSPPSHESGLLSALGQALRDAEGTEAGVEGEL